MHARQTQVFLAAGGGPVTWSIDPQVGSITSNGVYTAPKAILRGAKVTVTVSDGTAFDTASVELLSVSFWQHFLGGYYLACATFLLVLLIGFWESVCPNCRPAELRVSPPLATVTASQRVRFTSSAPVVWGDPVTASGLYSAPDTAPANANINITAASASDAKRTAAASLIWSPDIGVILQPEDATVNAGGTLEITPVFTIAPDKQDQIDPSKIVVEWMQPAVGKVSPRPDNPRLATFTAPPKGQLRRATTIMIMASAHLPGSPSRVAGTYVTVAPVSQSKGCREDGSAGTGTLIALIFLAGGLGGLIHGASSYAIFVGNREFKTSWTWWYALRPVLGGLVALVVYLVVRSGLGTGDMGLSTADCLKTAGFAGLIGMFAEPATIKLKDVFNAIFTPRQDPRGDAATPKQRTPDKPAPRITGISPSSVAHEVAPPPVLQVTGSNFAPGCVVKIGGVARKPSSFAPNRLEVPLQPGDIAAPGAVTVVVCNTPPDADNSNSMTLQVL